MIANLNKSFVVGTLNRASDGRWPRPREGAAVQRLRALLPRSAGAVPGGAHLMDGEPIHLHGASLREELDGLAAVAGEDLVGDHPLAVLGEDFNRRPIDQDVQAELAVGQSEWSLLHTGEGRVEADVAGLVSVHEEPTVVDVIADHGLLVAASSDHETEAVGGRFVEVDLDVEGLARGALAAERHRARGDRSLVELVDRASAKLTQLADRLAYELRAAVDGAQCELTRHAHRAPPRRGWDR